MPQHHVGTRYYTGVGRFSILYLIEQTRKINPATNVRQKRIQSSKCHYKQSPKQPPKLNEKQTKNSQHILQILSHKSLKINHRAHKKLPNVWVVVFCTVVCLEALKDFT